VFFIVVSWIIIVLQISFIDHHSSRATPNKVWDVCMLCLYIVWLVCNLQGVPLSSGPKREWMMIDQSDGDELYEVLNVQTQVC